jgi:hypothetical protein
MPFTTSLPAALICLSLAGLWMLGSPSVAKGQLRFDQCDAAVAAKLDDTVATVAFTFKNRGDYAILVKDVCTSCGCTTASADKGIYLPGDSGKIVATIQIGSFHGEMVKTVLVKTDDQADSATRLTIHLSVPFLVKLSKPTVELDRRGGHFAQTVTATVVDSSPLRIVGVRPWSDKISANFTVIREEKEYQIIVMMRDAKEELFSAVEILTDTEKPSMRRRIWLMVHVAGPRPAPAQGVKG